MGSTSGNWGKNGSVRLVELTRKYTSQIFCMLSRSMSASYILTAGVSVVMVMFLLAKEICW